ncbi:MAG: hypothetical protein WAW36_18925 [Methylovulum miyakonense]|uniref:hypothetical protein n=1 Tax=Methylovulum miyakonense TaxID=645578 RepID=UPI003BB5F930
MQMYFDINADVCESPAQWAEDEELEEGEEFKLISVEVLGANTYKIINGVPMLIAIAQPEGVEHA